MEAFEKMYSVKEAAGVLGWSPDTVRRLIYRKHLRAVTYRRRTNTCEYTTVRKEGSGVALTGPPIRRYNPTYSAQTLTIAIL